jgi:hypothetical protein
MHVTPNKSLQQTAGHDWFWHFKLSGAPPLLSFGV